ncbi:MAG TPA: magnesium-translocating P-type ATPase [Streptosporangiaceae bacterium]|nr:magnesium-translocating P-type ATPase [Streptosporangiaceae bacterium]
MTATPLVRRPGSPEAAIDLAAASAMDASQVLGALGSSPDGLSAAEAAARLVRYGQNAVVSHRARPWPVLWHQLKSPLLGLLAVAAIASYFVGERSDAVIIGVILALSVGMGFGNEYRAERAAEALHSQIKHRALVLRDGAPLSVDVTELVPGDLVELQLGDVVPADLRLLAGPGLECDESILTGESMPAEKKLDPVPEGTVLAERSDCALMGTVVRAGSGRGVVVATGSHAELGRIAVGLGAHQLETEFQAGLRRFSVLLVEVAIALTSTIFVINVVLHKPIINALLFSLAIAVGITPQLLPAVVSTSLAAGSRQMAMRKVLVKRLVCIEDLGDVDVLFTDKTGTLTEGRISFMRSVDFDGTPAGSALRWGLVCNEAAVSGGQVVGGNPLDVALWESPAALADRAEVAGYTTVAVLPFDHERRMVSVLADAPGGDRILITKGAPEAVLDHCAGVPDRARIALAAEFAAGNRVVAIATRPAAGQAGLTAADERDLHLAGLLVFLDAPKSSAGPALRRLAGLGVTVKIVTGDNAAVAAKVCADLGLPVGAILTGADVDKLDDAGLQAAIGTATVFARVSPEHKARIVRAQRQTGVDVAFLGDGVNDALALHAADVGISVDSATDVAKDAADVILLEKDLDVLADGIVEGRRIFANTIKYVLMGTSSNFGNMFSAAGASLFLKFLPMLPSQILLNNLLYDTSQLSIPTDFVDEEQLARPSRWDVGFIRRFMLYFGPISSIFDFVTFGIMLWVFHAGPALFRSGWFVESLATQTLVIFAIRTRRIPFFRSRPSRPLLLASLGVVLLGTLLPASPLSALLGFRALPIGFYGALALMVICYLGLIEVGKRVFYRAAGQAALPVRPHAWLRHLRRRADRFSMSLSPVRGQQRRRPGDRGAPTAAAEARRGPAAGVGRPGP